MEGRTERDRGALSRAATEAPEHPILLFDGVCNLCNGAVQFFIRRDSKARLRFAALQSEAGRALLHATEQGPVPQRLHATAERQRQEVAESWEREDDAVDSVILVADGRLFVKSTAVLKSLRYLPYPWRLLSMLLLVPRAVRDGVYDEVARHRYRWFGRRVSCMIPTPELRDRFLSDPDRN